MTDVEKEALIFEKKGKYDPLTYKIIGAAMKVHSVLGPGLLEAAYGDALCIEFKKQGIPFEREKEIDLFYEGIPLEHKYRADFVCFGKVIIELKATSDLINAHKAQIIHYLKSTKFECGLLLNFGKGSLVKQRFFN